MRTKYSFGLAAGALALMALSACKPASQSSQAAAAHPPQASDPGAALPPFVGRTWMSMDRGQPLGSILVFLPDKSLLMDSCFETFRIVEWGLVSADTIRWREDAIPIQAQWSQPTPESLTFRIAGIDEPQTYVAASVPYLCPEMPK